MRTDLSVSAWQVTALGGLEAVMANKKWTEVSQPFQFPPSFTSKSFTLRKMYSRLLHDYEQVYFHRSRGQPTPPPGELSFSTDTITVQTGFMRSGGN